MFVVYYQDGSHARRYFHPNKYLQKTIKTAFALPERFRKEFEKACINNPTMHLLTVSVSPAAEMMYPNGVQKNKIEW